MKILAGRSVLLPIICCVVYLVSVRVASAEQGFSGVGIQAVPIAGGELVILRVLPETAAEKAGLRPGDLIVQVDDFALAGSDFEVVVREHLWGEIGSDLIIHYLRPGVDGSNEVRVIRAQVRGKVEETPGVKLLQPRPQ